MRAVEKKDLKKDVKIPIASKYRRHLQEEGMAKQLIEDAEFMIEALKER